MVLGGWMKYRCLVSDYDIICDPTIFNLWKFSMSYRSRFSRLQWLISTISSCNWICLVTYIIGSRDILWLGYFANTLHNGCRFWFHRPHPGERIEPLVCDGDIVNDIIVRELTVPQTICSDLSNFFDLLRYMLGSARYVEQMEYRLTCQWMLWIRIARIRTYSY